MAKRKTTTTTADIPTSHVLSGALRAGLKDILILGILPDGTHYAAASTSDPDRLDWMVDTFVETMESGGYEAGEPHRTED